MADISELLELGKQIEYTGMELQEFVAKQQELQREGRLRREEEADKRRVEEEADKRRMERDTEKRRFQHEQEAKEAKAAEHRHEMGRLKLQVDQERWKAEQERKAYAEGDAFEEDQFKVRQNAPPKLDVPKFENKLLKLVAKYLQPFESVVKQNGSSEETWPLALRTAVVGTT